MDSRDKFYENRWGIFTHFLCRSNDSEYWNKAFGMTKKVDVSSSHDPTGGDFKTKKSVQYKDKENENYDANGRPSTSTSGGGTVGGTDPEQTPAGR